MGAPAMEDVAAAERAHERRLRLLYEISKLLTRFESAETTVPRILALATEAVPLRSAIVILEGRGPRARGRALVWTAEEVSASHLRAAKDHAKTSYAYLTSASGGLHALEEKAGAKSLPGPRVAPLAKGREGKA